MRGRGFEVSFDTTTGMLCGYRVGGQQLLAESWALNFWRVPTDNDRGWHMPEELAVWKDAGQRAVVREIRTAGIAADALCLAVTLAIPVGMTTCELVYQVHGNGTLDVTCALQPHGEALPLLPRIGLAGVLPGAYSQIAWYGRGPHESYADRLTGAALGTYTASLEEWVHDYDRPQENGNRCDVRWARFTDAAGRGLQITALGEPLSLGAWPYSQTDLEAARHPHELPRGDRVWLQVDHRQMGLGGDTSWGERVHPEYRLPADRPYRYAFRLSAVTG